MWQVLANERYPLGWVLREYRRVMFGAPRPQWSAGEAGHDLA